MEYFLLLDGKKQGPFDMIAIIKKVKNGALNAESLISQGAGAEFVKASDIPEVAELIEEHAHPNVDGSSFGGKITLKACVLEGVELWSRRIIDYTLLAGLVLAAAFGVRMLASKAMPDSILPAYLGGVLAIFLFSLFFCYVLETKRSQSIDIKEFLQVVKRNALGFAGLSLFLGLFILPYGIGMTAGLLFNFVFVFIITLLVFTPFLAKDAGVGVLESARLSAKRVIKVGGDNFGVIFAVVALNLFVAILPGLIMPELLGIGLFLSLPVTISALAYIYDQIFV